MSKKFIKIGEAAKLLGVSIETMRRWEQTEELVPHRKTKGGTRYYDINKLTITENNDYPTVCYARVSSHDQKSDLIRQQELLETYCAAKGWKSYMITDLGSGMNYKKKGLQKLLEMILHKKMKRLVLTTKDRLLRFGSELVFSLCEIQGIEIIIIHQGSQPSFEEELASDVLEIITVFSARLYGSRSKKNRKLIQTLQEEADKIIEELESKKSKDKQ